MIGDNKKLKDNKILLLAGKKYLVKIESGMTRNIYLVVKSRSNLL